MVRKPIYSPDEAKARQYKRQSAWSREHMTTINIRLLPIDKARYAAYAAHVGLPLATMMRACVEQCIIDDNWTWEPQTPDELAIVQADADRRRKD